VVTLQSLRALLFLAGFVYLLTGLVMLAAPQWFFETVGYHPPFNRHYIGDVAAFILPFGAGLMLAARQPERWRNVTGLAALASMLHAVNHAYDALSHHMTLEHWLVDTLPLLSLGLLLTFIFFNRRSRHEVTAS
jgi:thiol:disulfide interchange protein